MVFMSTCDAMMDHDTDHMCATPALIGEAPRAAHTRSARVVRMGATWIVYSHAAHQPLPLPAMHPTGKTELVMPEVAEFVRDRDTDKRIIVLPEQHRVEADVMMTGIGAPGAAPAQVEGERRHTDAVLRT